MIRRRRGLLIPLGAFAGLLAIAGPAFACTNYVGRTDLKGNSGTAHTVSNGLQCGDNVGGPIAACTQAMTVSTGTGDATAHSGGTLAITTAIADTGTTCRGLSGSPHCYLNDTSGTNKINYPSGNSGYDVNIINVGFSSHNSNPTSAQDCMSWSGNPNHFVKVATVTVAGGAGVLSGVTGVTGFPASFSSGTATVTLPTLSINTGGKEAGMCISDTAGEDGIQVPFTVN